MTLIELLIFTIIMTVGQCFGQFTVDAMEWSWWIGIPVGFVYSYLIICPFALVSWLETRHQPWCLSCKTKKNKFKGEMRDGEPISVCPCGLVYDMRKAKFFYLVEDGKNVLKLKKKPFGKWVPASDQ